jgi:putative (di)nucleoside polyphosphate hydrolase
MRDAFFRAGVGAVVFDETRHILLLQRMGAVDRKWQLPQGGINFGEMPEDALFRELKEEINLERDNLKLVTHTREWLTYELPPASRNMKVGWGQVQRWYLCRLLTSRSAVRPDQVEFSSAEWVKASEVVDRAVAFRLAVYKKVLAEFAAHIDAN